LRQNGCSTRGTATKQVLNKLNGTADLLNIQKYYFDTTKINTSLLNKITELIYSAGLHEQRGSKQMQVGSGASFTKLTCVSDVSSGNFLL
jgi:hypothetical protein